MLKKQICVTHPQCVKSNFSSILIVFGSFFTWIALGNVDLHFSLILVTKSNAGEGGTISAACLHHQYNQPIHVTDGVTVTSLPDSLQRKISAATDRLCQFMLNQKLSCTVNAK